MNNFFQIYVWKSSCDFNVDEKRQEFNYLSIVSFAVFPLAISPSLFIFYLFILCNS